MSDIPIEERVLSKKEIDFFNPSFLEKNDVVPLGYDPRGRLILGIENDLHIYTQTNIRFLLGEEISLRKLGPEGFKECHSAYLREHYPEELVPKPVQMEFAFP